MEKSGYQSEQKINAQFTKHNQVAFPKAIEWVDSNGLTDINITMNTGRKSSLKTLREQRTTNRIAR